MISTSIIIPVYNEEKTVLNILDKIKNLKVRSDIEVIVINDGSTDNTKKIIEDNKKYYSKVLHLDRNSGKGRAVIEGLKIATGDYVFFQDADLEYSPEDMHNFVEIVINNKADLIMGSRFTAERRSVLHFWHMLGNRFITFIFNVLNNTTFTDIYCCYCLFERKKLEVNKLKSFGWGQQAEILTYLAFNANKIYESAVSYDGRKYQEGKKIKYYHVIEVIYWIIATRLKTLIK